MVISYVLMFRPQRGCNLGDSSFMTAMRRSRARLLTLSLQRCRHLQTSSVPAELDVALHGTPSERLTHFNNLSLKQSAFISWMLLSPVS